jgi:hypothetical protein
LRERALEVRAEAVTGRLLAAEQVAERWPVPTSQVHRRTREGSPVDAVDLPRAPTYSEIRYLTNDEVWMLVEAVARSASRQPTS